MKKTIGILAHVDAGKTTFSEQLLYLTKSIKEVGRVDHKNAYLDLHSVEQQRGITVFADEASFSYEQNDYTLIDTPGHVDFSAEMERSILALDGAILLLDGTDGVQGHTDTIWSLLKKHQIPTIFFANKMDQLSADEKVVERDIQQKLTESALSLKDWVSSIEDFALLKEETTAVFLEEMWTNNEWMNAMKNAFMARDYFPILYGSALKNEGIEWLLEVMDYLLEPHARIGDLQGIIYKIRHIEQNQRIAFVKITQGSLKVRQALTLNGETHKITQLRKYNGSKFKEVQEAIVGETIAVIGLKNAQVGMHLASDELYEQQLIPTMRASVQFKSSLHPKEMMAYFSLLEIEDPALGVEWREETQEIQVKIMGTIQLEVLSQVFEERFGEIITFDEPTIIYKETIESAVKGYGHFEPLKHYAEVHLFIEPGERGNGVQVVSKCHPNDLQQGYQNVIAQYLKEGGHHGVLTGAEVTDLNITILTGRAHQKHTEGGDFREASLRALRQGLEQAENILLEPFYSFKMKADLELMGRMMTDLKMMHGQVDEPEIIGNQVTLTGIAPVVSFVGYTNQFAAYTNGRGSLQLQFAKYERCHNAKEIIESSEYRRDADAAYSSNSVFCAKGKGYTVPWQEAKQAMHCPID